MTVREPRSRAQLALGADVAIKLLAWSSSGDAEARLRLVQQASDASRIDPAHVVRVLDHGFSTGGRGFIIMERLHGKDLAQHLAQTGSMTPKEAAAIATPACAGLEAGHALGLVHGHIEPGNIFLHEVGGRVVVKLLNFGILRDTHAEARAVDPRSDLHALAVVAYRCITGRMPFEGPVPRGGRGPPIPPSTFNPAVSSALDAWFSDMLRDDVDARPCQSATELGETFAAACGAPSPRAAASSRVTAPRLVTSRARAGKPDHERRRTLIGLCGAIFVTMMSAIFGLWLRHRGEGSPALEPGDTARGRGPEAAGLPAIHLHFSVMPPEATLTLDGQRLAGNPFSSTRLADGMLHRLSAEARGYQSIERDIGLSRDITVELMLSPVAAPSPEPTSAERDAPRSAPSNRSTRAPPLSPGPVVAPPARDARPVPPARKLPLNIDRSNPWRER
jgi:hypothetical protein